MLLGGNTASQCAPKWSQWQNLIIKFQLFKTEVFLESNFLINSAFLLPTSLWTFDFFITNTRFPWNIFLAVPLTVTNIYYFNLLCHGFATRWHHHNILINSLNLGISFVGWGMVVTSSLCELDSDHELYCVHMFAGRLSTEGRCSRTYSN